MSPRVVALSGMELPPPPLEKWKDTKKTLHRYTQVVGKVRTGLSSRTNHWWPVTLHVTPRGPTPGPIPHSAGTFDISFDLLENRPLVAAGEQGEFSFALDNSPGADSYSSLVGRLGSLGIETSINTKPFDLDGAQTRPGQRSRTGTRKISVPSRPARTVNFKEFA